MALAATAPDWTAQETVRRCNDNCFFRELRLVLREPVYLSVVPKRGSLDVQRLRRAVGARIAGRRKAQELSQEELAGRIGGRAGRLSMIENGHSEPSLSELLRLREALGMSLDELVAGTPADAPEGGLPAAPADAGPSAALRSALQRIERACNSRQLAILADVMNGLATALESGAGPDRPTGTDA